MNNAVGIVWNVWSKLFGSVMGREQNRIFHTWIDIVVAADTGSCLQVIDNIENIEGWISGTGKIVDHVSIRNMLVNNKIA
jgi:hypothetical protein